MDYLWKKVHKVIKFNQNAWLKPYIDMNTDLSNKLNHAIFGNVIENVRKHRGIKLVTTELRRNYLVSEPNDHTRKFFAENLLAIEMKKHKNTEICMNKSVYLGLSILELSKILAWVLVWLCKTKIWWKSKTVLYGCR